MFDFFYLDDYDPAIHRKFDLPVFDRDSLDEPRTRRTSRAVQLDGVCETASMEEVWVHGLANPTTVSDVAAPEPTGFWGIPAKKGRKKGKKMTDWDMDASALEPQPAHPDESPASFLAVHAQVFAIASKYDVERLRDVAIQKFKAQVQSGFHVPDMIRAIPIVFEQTPENQADLREILKDTIAKHAHTLVQQPAFKEAVEDISGLTYDLLSWKSLH